MSRRIPDSEMPVNADGSAFHLHILPEQLADRVVLVGDPSRVKSVAAHFESQECDVQNREFHTITGSYKGKRITVISHGIGGDNIDIVLTELDALANIDFEKRTIKPSFRQLSLVRIGTSGGLQPFVPIGTFVAAEYSVGFDGVLYFYEENEQVRNREFEQELLQQLDWKIEGLKPYVVGADQELLKQITQDDIIHGVTIATNGFYGAQGRWVRLAIADKDLNNKIMNFNYQGRNITNFEMESSALAGLASLMGHRALTICCIIAGRVDKTMNTNYKKGLEGLIEIVLDRI